jgi:thiamine kinase-like enzyme
LIIPPSNEFLVNVFNQFSQKKAKKVIKREFYDKSLYSMLEFLTFDISNEKFVLKTLKRPVKQEIIIHRFVNDFAINGATFVAGFSSDFLNLHFIIMSFIKNITPVFIYEENDLLDDYILLAKNLGDLHVKSRSNIKKLRLENIIQFNSEYYQKLLDKFSEKLPMLSKKINHELYLTPDTIEIFLQHIDPIKNSLASIKNLRRTLVHGDLDFGNIFFKPSESTKQIIVIDWGLSHIDLPIIDMANLLNSLQTLSEDDRKLVLDSYLNVALKNFPKNYSLENFESIGMILHKLFFIEFQLNTLEMSSTSIEDFYEQIHNALISITELVN